MGLYLLYKSINFDADLGRILGGEVTHEEMKILKLGKFSMLHLVQNSLKVFHSGKEFEQEATAGVNYYFSVFVFWV